VKKHALVSRHSQYIYAKQYAQFMMVEAVLCDIDGAEHMYGRISARRIHNEQCEVQNGARSMYVYKGVEN